MTFLLSREGVKVQKVLFEKEFVMNLLASTRFFLQKNVN